MTPFSCADMNTHITHKYKHIHAVRQTLDLFVLTEAQEVTIRQACVFICVFVCVWVCRYIGRWDFWLFSLFLIVFYVVMSYLGVSKEHLSYLT